MTLVGNRYIQTGDPGAVGCGYQWCNSSTGVLYERNVANNAWVTVGNVGLTNYGSLPITGGAMTGAITGVTGWAPLDAPNFTTSAKLSSVNLATTTDLSNLQTTLTNLINAQIASGFSALNSSLSISNSIAWGYGTVYDGGTIPLPSYSDRQALHSEIVVMLVAHSGYKTLPPSGPDYCAEMSTTNTGSEARSHGHTAYVNTSTRVVTCGTFAAGDGAASNDSYANYVIICVKSTS